MVEPRVWGPPFWSTVHYTALGYPMEPSEDEVHAYGTFFSTIGRVLPCALCRGNFQKHVYNLPLEPHLLNTDTLFAWTVALHNAVNRDSGKPELSVQEARDFYLTRKPNEHSPPHTQHSHAGSNVLLAVLVGIACALATALAVCVIHLCLRRHMRRAH